ncbi:unnamed protein product [Cuscuta epithymum]|uniref:Uncharacterized protein n=1 Tax=Cuscuta epithymum TaxID=186058 RepID=A0AAV0CNV6_9ASTE|nr:unnamed protein product [Cuscuta epithymum]
MRAGRVEGFERHRAGVDGRRRVAGEGRRRNTAGRGDDVYEGHFRESCGVQRL